MIFQTQTFAGREYRKIPIVRLECTVAYRFRETLRSRLSRWARRNLIDSNPQDDESHAATRYEGK